MKLDRKSMHILRILQEKARIPNIDIAKQVGLAPSAVLERIRKMENQNVIDGYEVRLNPERFEKNQITFITIQCREEAGASGKLGEKLAAIEEIQEVHYITGTDSYFIKLRASGTKHVEEILRQKILIMQEVQSTSTAIVLRTFKETSAIPIR